MDCGNYKGINLTEHGLKVSERILHERLREVVKIREQQYGFMRGGRTADGIFIVRQLQEKRLEGNQELFCAVGEVKSFEVSVGLHQGSALSPFLFVLVMDVLSEEIRNEELWEFL
ncbi:uncharacterized protein LOC135216522 [Macrobrachium nipponense]|uniref:uncharacterized protein LOC135216522 n=1 Tax=Macrobrachium nipponense TaxID=159736 RepID=UPI0030C7C64C